MNLIRLANLFIQAGGWLSREFMQDEGYDPTLLRHAGMVELLPWRNTVCYAPAGGLAELIQRKERGLV